MSNIYIIEDDPVMADCLSLWARRVAPSAEIVQFPDAIAAINHLDQQMPDLILLDVLLNGVDGFTFLNELMSYRDTAQIPILLITSLDLSHQNLQHYGIYQVLDKAVMTPLELRTAIAVGLDLSQSRAVQDVV